MPDNVVKFRRPDKKPAPQNSKGPSPIAALVIAAIAIAAFGAIYFLLR